MRQVGVSLQEISSCSQSGWSSGASTGGGSPQDSSRWD